MRVRVCVCVHVCVCVISFGGGGKLWGFELTVSNESLPMMQEAMTQLYPMHSPRAQD